MRHAVLLLLISLAAAQADILHLHNGRSLEGQIVRRTPETITLKMNFGRMTVRVDQVKEIERRLRPEHELAERYRAIDPTNPAQLERLSMWASRRGLGREASDLSDHARGIRLERKLEAIRDSRRVQDWLDVYTWARVNDVSDTVQLHLLSTAKGIDPDDRALQAVLRAREEEARAAAWRQAEIERRRNEPIFKMPDDNRSGVAIRNRGMLPVVDQKREAREGRVKRIAEGSGLRPRSTEAEAKIKELEARVEAQEKRAKEQAEKEAEQEAELQRLRRQRRVRRGNRNPNGPQLIRARPLPPGPPPAQAPRPGRQVPR